MYLDDILPDEKNYRKTQLKKAIFSEFVESFDDITVFPKELREKLTTEVPFSSFKVLSHKKTGDTEKILIEFTDGKKAEAVLMRHPGRRTVCVSCQVGCAANCSFCSTGALGFTRHLSDREIIEQVLFFSRQLKREWQKNHPGEKWSVTKASPEYRVRNVVFMGMGEPLQNFDNVSEAIKAFGSPEGFNLSMRRVTVSTVGIAKNVQKLLDFPQPPNLAVSLHAATDELRSEIVPTNMGFPLKELFEALDAYSKKTKNRIFYEWTVLRDINDTDEQTHALGELLQRRNAHVNFIPWNPGPSRIKYRKPSIDHIRRMQKILDEEYGVKSTIRATYGDEVGAACGQLAAGKTEERDQEE